MANNELRKEQITCEFPPHAEHNSKDISEAVIAAWESLKNKTCPGAEMTEWLHWPENYLNSSEYIDLKSTVNIIRTSFDAVVFIGIGGSFLTGKMFTSIRAGEMYNAIYGCPECYFLGYGLDDDNLENILYKLENAGNWAVVYTSKSGTTFEPAAAFNIVYSKLLEKFDNNAVEANKCVFAITDAKKGTLKKMADENGWKTFVIPDGIGGRFSGLTPVGLIPFGIINNNSSIEDLLLGAKDAVEDCYSNPDAFAFKYSKWRLLNNRSVEYLATNSALLTYLVEWMKQLFGETEGKDGKGIFTAGGVFPRELHSQGQFLQSGTRGLIFETQLISSFGKTREIYTLKKIDGLNDGLDEFYGRTLTEASEAAMHGAHVAHTEGGNPCGIIRFNAHNPYVLGNFMQHMLISASTCANAIGVNAFDQPGVELHKKVMKETLAKYGNK